MSEYMPYSWLQLKSTSASFPIKVLVFITDILVGLYQRVGFYTVQDIVGVDSSTCMKVHNSRTQY